MLKSLRIERYQSYYDSTFHFSSGVNGIIGISLSGKTAILRALKWALKNRPSGYRFHSDFSNRKTYVTTILDDDSKVTINRGNKQSVMYSLRLPDGTFMEWAKMGTKVPDVVTDKFNFSELNIQGQFDQPFLITSPPGEVARTINRITKAEKLDKWVKSLNSKINLLKFKRNERKVNLKEIKKDLKKYDDVEKLSRKVDGLERVTMKIKDLDDEHEKIDGLLANIEDAKITIKTQKQFLKAKDSIEQIEQIEHELSLLDVEAMMIETISETQGQLHQAQEERQELVSEYTTTLKKKKICPYCFKRVNDADLKRIINEIHAT